MTSENPCICYCINVKQHDIIQSIQNGASSVAEVRKATRACTGCQSCYADIEILLDKHTPKETNEQK